MSDKRTGKKMKKQSLAPAHVPGTLSAAEPALVPTAALKKKQK
jgi:hypothetical protein